MDLATPTIYKTGQNNYGVSYGDSSQNYVEFEKVAVLNSAQSDKTGHPVYENKDFIRIRFPGDKTKEVHKPVTDRHKQEYPRQWDAYQKNETLEIKGVPLTEWPPLTPADVKNLKGMGIHTVEMLADLPDSALTWLGSRSYRDKAVSWLKNAKDGSGITALQAENDALRTDVEMLKTQIKQLSTIKKGKKDDTQD